MNPSNQASRTTLPCRNLCSKEMFHEEYGQEDDDFSSGQYWCQLTQETFGPDGQPVDREECCKKRGCFVG